MEPLVILGIIAILAGIIGSIVPALPGPAISFLGIILLFFGVPGEVSFWTLLIFGLGLMILLALGYFGPIFGARFMGATKRGMVGAFIGAVLGLIFFAPLGLFIGALLGAYAAEILSGQKNRKAVKSAFGVLLGSSFVMAAQILYSLVAAIYYVWQLF